MKKQNRNCYLHKVQVDGAVQLQILLRMINAYKGIWRFFYFFKGGGIGAEILGNYRTWISSLDLILLDPELTK